MSIVRKPSYSAVIVTTFGDDPDSAGVSEIGDDVVLPAGMKAKVGTGSVVESWIAAILRGHGYGGRARGSNAATAKRTGQRLDCQPHGPQLGRGCRD